MKLILPESVASMIEPHLPRVLDTYQVVHIDEEGRADGDLADANVLLRWWTPRAVFAQILRTTPQLRWIHTPSAGVDGLLIPEFLERDVLMTTSAGSHSIPIAEFVLMFVLSRVKHTRELMALTPENAWTAGHEQLELDELTGKTMLILGMGQIGQETAKRASAFGMRVFGSRRRALPTEHVERVVGEHEWQALLPETDYLVIATPLTDATRSMINAEVLSALKPGAYIVNIARGEIIDTDALIAALHSGQIGGAALDALPEEPLPATHPLWQAPNCWITPHISWSSPKTPQRAIELFLDNLARFRDGLPLRNLVDKQAGY
jgi:phosphoglycerate dehydrogenase-like enzyme